MGDLPGLDAGYPEAFAHVDLMVASTRGLLDGGLTSGLAAITVVNQLADWAPEILRGLAAVALVRLAEGRAEL